MGQADVGSGGAVVTRPAPAGCRGLLSRQLGQHRTRGTGVLLEPVGVQCQGC